MFEHLGWKVSLKLAEDRVMFFIFALGALYYPASSPQLYFNGVADDPRARGCKNASLWQSYVEMLPLFSADGVYARLLVGVSLKTADAGRSPRVATVRMKKNTVPLS